MIWEHDKWTGGHKVVGKGQQRGTIRVLLPTRRVTRSSKTTGIFESREIPMNQTWLKEEYDKAEKKRVYTQGQTVMFWEKLTEYVTHKAADDGIKKKRAPYKLTMRWSGPHTVISQDERNKNLVLIKHARRGEVTANVNRLQPYHQWSAAHPSTHQVHIEGEDRPPTGPVPPAQQFKTKSKPVPGDIIVFKLEKKIESDLPFGVGKFIRTRSDKYVEFQWMGSLHKERNPDCTYRLGWIDLQGVIYYKDGKEHPSHTSYTNDKAGATWIKESHILASGVKLMRLKLPPRVLRLLHDDRSVQWQNPKYSDQ